MSIKELILEGEEVKKKNLVKGDISYINGEEYENWIAKCVIILQRSNYNKEMTNKFLQASKRAVGNGLEYYNTMMGILKALDQLGEEQI